MSPNRLANMRGFSKSYATELGRFPVVVWVGLSTVRTCNCLASWGQKKPLKGRDYDGPFRPSTVVRLIINTSMNAVSDE